MKKRWKGGCGRLREGTEISLFILSAISLTALHPAPGNSKNWVQVPEIGSTLVYSVIGHNGALYAATFDSVFTSADGGGSWQATAGQPALTNDLNRLFSHGAFLYAATLVDGVFRSSDGGQSWQDYSTGLPGGGIVTMTALGDSIYAGTDGSGVYVRHLSGSSNWTAFNDGLFQSGVISLGTSGSYLVAGVGLYLFVRPRGGPQWFNVDLDSAGSQLLIYETMTQGPYLFAGTDKGVYRGDLNVQNWQKTDIAGLPDRDIEALAVDGSRLYAGLRFSLQHYIWYTDDYGANWQIQAHEFTQLFDLLVSGGRLWAGRLDGLWYLAIATDAQEPKLRVPSGYHLGQNYPNPFNASTAITFTLPKSGRVELKLFDLLGREVLTLFSGFKSVGTHTVGFDAAGLASGVYIYKISAGEYEASRKMVLVK